MTTMNVGTESADIEDILDDISDNDGQLYARKMSLDELSTLSEIVEITIDTMMSDSMSSEDAIQHLVNINVIINDIIEVRLDELSIDVFEDEMTSAIDRGCFVVIASESFH